MLDGEGRYLFCHDGVDCVRLWEMTGGKSSGRSPKTDDKAGNGEENMEL